MMPVMLPALVLGFSSLPSAPDLPSTCLELGADAAILPGLTGSVSGRPQVVLHFGANYEPYDFLVNKPGAPATQTGFGFEFGKLVCEICDLDCITVRDQYERCWQVDNNPGSGVQGGYYHGCSTYTNTFLRQTGVDFGDSYTTMRPAGILSRLVDGKPVIPPNASLTGFRIGIVGGWATDEPSLAFLVNGCTGETFNGYTTSTPADPFFGPDAVMRELLAGEVDGIYMYASTIDDRMECSPPACDSSLYQGLGEQYAWIHTGLVEYQANGTTLAFTKRGSNLHNLLNPCIQKALQTKEYADLCFEYIVNRGFTDITCFDNEFMNITSSPSERGGQTDLERLEACESDPNAEGCSCAEGYCSCLENP